VRALRVRVAIGVAVALMAAALAAIALGAFEGGRGQSDGSNGEQQAPRGPPPGADADEFRSCLEEQGVEAPEGPPSGDPQERLNDSDFRRALEACREYLPEGGPAGQGPLTGGP